MTSDQDDFTKPVQDALAQGNRHQARSILLQATADNPEDHRPWLWLAGITDSPKASLSYIDRAEALCPDDPAVAKARYWAENRLVESNRKNEEVKPEKEKVIHAYDLLTIIIGWAVLVILVYFQAELEFLWPLRGLLGVPFIMLGPGYAILAAFDSKHDDLNLPLHLGFSFPISSVLFLFIVLIFDKYGWGIPMAEILLLEGMIIAPFLLIAWIRRKL